LRSHLRDNDCHQAIEPLCRARNIVFIERNLRVTGTLVDKAGSSLGGSNRKYVSFSIVGC